MVSVTKAPRRGQSRGAEWIANQADGTAYYDPKTDQAFVLNDP